MFAPHTYIGPVELQKIINGYCCFLLKIFIPGFLFSVVLTEPSRIDLI